MPEASSAAQLERLLYILPVAARQDGVTLAELAHALGVDQRTVLHELEQAMTRAYYHPAGSVDAFTISIEHKRVRVHAPEHFRRPVRLHAREALALGLGLRALAAEAAEPRRAELTALAHRLERELQVPVHELQPRVQPAPKDDEGSIAEESPPLHIELEADDYLGVLADAIARHRVCTISYLKPGARNKAERRIAPLLLVHDRGRWYVAAHDREQDERRLFRLDRVLSVRIEDETFDRAAMADTTDALRTRGFAYHGDEDAETEVRVRYSPRIARWLAEHMQLQCEADGALVVPHRVADLDWLVRHVLQYGQDAEVLAPPEARARVRAFARSMTGE
jgi:proteasome accessory factor C